MLAVAPAGIPSLTIGGRVFTDLANLICLVGSFSSSNYSVCRLPNGSAGYTPSGAKTFRIEAVQLNVITQAAATAFTLGYQDNDVGINSGTAATNAVFLGKSGGSIYVGSLSTVGQVSASFALSGSLIVPNGKFAFVNGGGAAVGTAFLYGYEV